MNLPFAWPDVALSLKILGLPYKRLVLTMQKTNGISLG
jgi:hypothetical protein